MSKVSNREDVLDVRDIIERFEELEESRDAFQSENELEDYQGEKTSAEKWGEWEDENEYNNIKGLLEDLKGNGGDEQWRGEWYPLTLIREDYFEDYCEELVSDIGGLPREIPSYIVIDWSKTAENLKVDFTYFSVDFDGETYWTR